MALKEKLQRELVRGEYDDARDITEEELDWGLLKWIMVMLLIVASAIFLGVMWINYMGI